jgi:FKBP-type peptidyl-prolyl cis-trans isomerase (trigger factor)
MAHDVHLSFAAEKTGTDRCKAVIKISPHYVNSIYQYILRVKQSSIVTQGFIKGTTPLSYIEYMFKQNILEHLKELFYTHCVINYLYHQITINRINIAGEPIFKEALLDPQQGAVYVFDLSQLTPPAKNDWKRLPFKAPTRKNYKDLDRQVEFFIDEEHKASEAHAKDGINQGDWIRFNMSIVDENGQPLMPGYCDHVWLRLGDEIIDRDAYELFEGKHVGDTFISDSDLLQEYVSTSFDIRYSFLIEIKDRVPHTHFSLDHFKKHFKIKTARETHAKLIEVFSYRNDISQRRETIEAVFKLLLQHYSFEAPENLTSRQQELVLRLMQSNPDYHVYKTQPDFKNKVRMLAEKQVRENILIDYLSYDEQIQASDEDIVNYLNLTKRQRTKEFIYFDMPSFKAKGHETPVPNELIRYCCLHEKTLNYLVSYLTKRA